jgi:hypothetical protein
MMATRRQPPRRELLIAQINIEREAVADAWYRARQRIALANEAISTLKVVARSPIMLPVISVVLLLSARRPSGALAKTLAVGWSVWKRVANHERD